ncbi:glycerol-3-phosphate dehydrogenase/oxidase [Corynebacterium halotolerans]|uniref:glycerol-3-phosphate dehydrogenase/oxidase n=1 Tax=Corynebacterium halotolerans TaxID=225326 RepID=UPI003CED7BA2
MKNSTATEARITSLRRPRDTGPAQFGDRALGPPVHGHYDVVVIGGGISGVQVARHAIGRGLRTVLFEAGDYSCGTSAATSKMIHGGLRYLEQHDFLQVQEAVNERRYLGIAAPHLVVPRSFLLAAYDWSEPKAPTLGAGVALYEAMALKRNAGLPRDNRSPRLRWVGKRNLLKQVPWLNPEGLRGAWRHDDALNLHAERLLLGILKSVVADGGTAVNHAKVTRILRDPARARVTGVAVTDQLTGHVVEVAASVVINAAGPWAQEALGDVAGQAQMRVRQSKGVHLVTDDLGATAGVFVRGRNGHHIIVNPWEGRTIIGPTDTPVYGPPERAQATGEDVGQLLETFDSVRATPLDRGQIRTTLVGVRPLVDDGSTTYTASRRFSVSTHAAQGLCGLYSVTGGKWTTARLMGQKVMDQVIREQRELLPPVRSFDSRFLSLSTSFGDYGTVADALRAALHRGPDTGLPEATRVHLARLYGTEHVSVLELVLGQPDLAEPLDPTGQSRDIAAQAVYAVTGEAARTLADVLDRRLVLGTLGVVPSRRCDAPPRRSAPCSAGTGNGPGQRWPPTSHTSSVCRMCWMTTGVHPTGLADGGAPRCGGFVGARS